MWWENSGSSPQSGGLPVGPDYMNAFTTQPWTWQDTYWVLATQVQVVNTKITQVSEAQVPYCPVEKTAKGIINQSVMQ